MSFSEHFTVLDQNAQAVAKFADRTAAAYEHSFGKAARYYWVHLRGNRTRPNRCPCIHWEKFW